ncbi:hypothetical protein POM88_035370 [Heracleum sosnowskyi]|uniref:Uncharacterized protein n=1 Tax=Heracleum sosnowskyi TaxID=360622 RepID=A0AAD8HM94_9APIA|nr:hypothetical protein POM88_035370 [Heracleum sosnowskyi]
MANIGHRKVGGSRTVNCFNESSSSVDWLGREMLEMRLRDKGKVDHDGERDSGPELVNVVGAEAGHVIRTTIGGQNGQFSYIAAHVVGTGSFGVVCENEDISLLLHGLKVNVIVTDHCHPKMIDIVFVLDFKHSPQTHSSSISPSNLSQLVSPDPLFSICCNIFACRQACKKVIGGGVVSLSYALEGPYLCDEEIERMELLYHTTVAAFELKRMISPMSKGIGSSSSLNLIVKPSR